MDTDQLPSLIGIIAICLSVAGGLGYFSWSRNRARHGGHRIDLRRQGYGPKLE